jgi:hypothetical protein
MKTVYPLVALLSAALVAAGPIPRANNLDSRTNDLVHTVNQVRTDHVGEPAPAPAPAPVDEHKKAADAMEAEHVAKAEAEAKAHQEGMKQPVVLGTLANLFSREESRRGARCKTGG